MCEANYNPRKNNGKYWRLPAAINWFQQCKSKYGDKFDYSKVVFNGVSKKTIISCPYHGDQNITPAQHLKSKTGCYECGQLLAAYKARQRERIVPELKKCTHCENELNLSLFNSRISKKKRKDGSIHSYRKYNSRCIDCERKLNRERVKRDRKTKDGRIKNIESCKAWQRSRKGEKWRLEKEKERKIATLNKALSCKVYLRKCKDCGRIDALKSKPVGKGVDYCRKCVRKYSTLGMKLVVKVKDVKCPDCGVIHKAKAINTLCSDCSKERRRLYESKNRISGSHAQRAKRYGNFRKWNVKKDKVFKRDKWRCQLCKCKVQKKNIYADNAAELDHIVPLSLGGPHTYSNVQTLCKKCNGFKGNTYAGQLVLSL